MSKTKTKRIVASFLLLCAMSGTKAFALPTDWNAGDNLSNPDFVQDGKVTIDKGSFNGRNTPASTAPFVINNDSAAVDVEFSAGNLTIQNYVNSAANGGAMSFGTAADGGTHNITVSGISQIINNSVTGTDANGGGVYNNANLTFSGSTTFSGNEANTYGGAIYNDASGSVTINGGTFTGNSAGSQGGAIYNAGNVTLDSSNSAISFSNNTANGQSNDVYLAGSGNMELTGTNTITFGGSVAGDDISSITSAASDLVLNGNNSNFAGSFEQTGGTTTVSGNGSKFFGGESTISRGDLYLKSQNALADGSSLILGATEQDNYDEVNVYINANNAINGNISGLGYIYNGDQNSSASTVTLTGDNSGFTGTYWQDKGSGKLVVAENAKSFAGTNTIDRSGLELKDDSTLLGTTTLTNSTFTSDGAIIAGTVDLTGNDADGEMTDTEIQNVFTVAGGSQLDLNGGNSIASTGSLNVISGGILNINQNLTLGGADNGLITSNTLDGYDTQGVVNMDNADTLTILGDQSGYVGQFNKTGGRIEINGGQFFGGTNDITNATVALTNSATMAGTNDLDGVTLTIDSSSTLEGDNTITNSSNITVNGTMQGKNEITGSKVTLNSGSTLAGSNTINSGSIVNIYTSNNTGATNTITGGTVNVGNGTDKTNLGGTNTISGGVVNVASGSQLDGANTTMSDGTISMTNAILNGLQSMTGGRLDMTGGTIAGTVNMSDGTSELSGVGINGSYNITNGSLTINDDSTFGSGAVLDIDGGTVNINQSIALTDGNITGDGGTLNMTQGATTLDISGNQSGFKGEFNKTGGRIEINGGQFFGGTNDITNATVALTNSATMAGTNDLDGVTLTIDSTSTLEGKNTITNSSNITVNGTMQGENEITGSTVTLNSGSTLAGSNTINSGSIVNINTTNTAGAENTINNGATVNVGDSNNTAALGGTNTISGGNVNVASGSRLDGANTTMSDGTISMTGAILNGLQSMTGGRLDMTGGSVTGPVAMSNGTGELSGVSIEGTYNITNGSLTINDDSTFGSGAVLDIDGGTVNINQSIALTDGNITGDGGTLNMTQGATNLDISGNQSGFKGEFNKTGGTINVENGSLFGGTNNINGTIVNMKDDSKLASGSTMVVGNGTGIKIENSGADHSAATNNIPGKTGDETVLSGTISSAVAEAGTITVSGENTYLVVDADMSGFTGDFTQSSDATTEVTENGIFFAGSNNINDGHFVFRDGAQLSNDVNINSKKVVLAFGDGSQQYVVEDGNRVYYYKDGVKGQHSFVMNYVTIKNTLYTGKADYKVIETDFGTNGGFDSDADYSIVQHGNPDVEQPTTVNMIDGSVAQDGAQLDVGEGTVLNITANYMEQDAQSSSKGGTFGADLTGVGTVKVQNTNDKDSALVFVSDNSGFKGTFNHEGGSIRFIGNGVDNAAANFFNGTNNIKAGGNVIFDANSVVMGNNKLSDGAYFEFKDGSSIDDSENNKAILDLTNGGQIDITNKTQGFDLNVGVIDPNGKGLINKTAGGALTISDNQSQYKGNFVQSGGGITTVSDGVSFFGGKNNINAGVVNLQGNTGDSKKGAILAGSNTISADGKMIIGDFTDTRSQLTSPVIVNTGFDENTGLATSDDVGLNLETKDGNETNLEVAFKIASGDDNLGKVTHTGDGALNLKNAETSDKFAGFNGIFEQTSTGITNVFGNSFKNNHIKNGVLNMKAGSTLVDGSTTLEAGTTLNIGTLKDDTTVNPEKFDDNSRVTIASDVKGAGDVNISQGKVTITGTSDNSGLTGTGTYYQTGGEVTAEAKSTFFGATVKNLIEKGKLLFKQEAKLANAADVTLDANTDLTGKTANTTAVLDLDNRDNAKFTGGNTLYIDGKDTEGFIFTDGVLQNALLHGEQTIGDNTVITMQGGSGFASDAVATIGGTGTNVILGTGAVAQEGADLTVDSLLTMVSENLDFKSEVVDGSGDIRVEKDMRETNAPNINIYGDQSKFEGGFYQDAGRVTVKSGATFFGSGNGKKIEITGITVTSDTEVDEQGNPVVIKETSGDLYLEKGSLLGSNITVTNFDKTSNAGVSTPHGRVFVEDKIFTQDGQELTNIDDLINQDNLYYNNVLKADGTVDADSLKQININNGGLILSNGTIFETTDGPAVFERKENGIIDIGFSNNTGVDGDILLKRDTMLSYGDNAYIKDDSTLEMEDTAILNFINDNAVINYNPEIVGGGSIYKEGLAATNISSAIDMTGEVNVKEGTLNFTNKDNVIFKKGNDLRQTGNLTVGSNSANASLSIIANQTEFQGDVKSDAQDGTQSVLALNGANTTIGGSLSNNNTVTSIFGNTSIGYNTADGTPGNWNIDGNSSLNLAGNYANTIDVAGDLILGANSALTDNKLPISFDYDPHRDAMDSIIVDSFVNTNDSPLLITGINFVTSPVDRTFSLDADRLIQQRNPQDQPYYDPTNFYANTAMGRYFLSNGAGGPDFSGTLVHLNPQQYRGQVATIASWQNQLLINNLLFDHMDIVTRQLMDDEKTANKYAATIPQFAPYQYDLKGGSLWYKAYGNFETLSMTKGLSVGNNAYGALIGADFPLIKLKHGWNIVPTAYIGYNGAHQHFNGVSMYQNGAQLGVMGTAYKGDFITSLLAYGGGYGNDMSMSGQYGSGSDNTGNWFAGVASKTAYNFHLPADFIFQPTVMAAYNAFGSQNWGSDFGVMSMSSGMLNGINVAPGFNLIWQKKSFNIYLTAQMVYNIMGGVDGRAGNIDLGYVRMRHSYFEYGLGVSKNFKDRFGGFLQFVIRNGGRTGIGFSGGLQIKLGK